jgi:uncharacterized protein YecT (DUF1311 family)
VWGTAREAPPVAAPVQASAAVPQPTPPPSAPTDLAAEAPAEAQPEPAVQPPADTPEVASAAESAAAEPAPNPPADHESQPATSAEADACAAQPTPADRTICADPQLRELQRQLRQAYSEALEAHEDRALLRERQLAWASARDSVSDPDRLIALYEQRIRKLNAATAQARQLR